MRLSTLFRITAVAIFVQIALGGLLTFGFINPLPHIVIGSIVFVMAVVTAAVSLRSKFQDKQLKEVSVALIAALMVQIILGFTALASNSDVVAWIHLLVAVVIYAIALTGMSFAMHQEYIHAMRQDDSKGVV